jgi:hypothetical protein
VNEANESREELTPTCAAFQWIGQPLTSCDECGRPAWEHDRQDAHRDRQPWSVSTVSHWLVRGVIGRERAAELLLITPEARPASERLSWEPS